MEQTKEKEDQAAFLERLGLKAAAGKVRQFKDAKRKMAIAYEHYRYVKPEKVTAFKKKLHERSAAEHYNVTYNLSFTKLAAYPAVPPADVLEKLSEAIGRNCFDYFEVAEVKKLPDPIIFGRIEGCTDRFYVAQWDTDVNIKDFIADNEG